MPLTIVGIISLPVVYLIQKRPHLGAYLVVLAICFPIRELITHPRAYLITDFVILLVAVLVLGPRLIKRPLIFDKTAKLIFLFVVANFLGLIITASGGIHREFITVGYIYTRVVQVLILYLIGFYALSAASTVKVLYRMMIGIGILAGTYFLAEYVLVMGLVSATDMEARTLYDAYYNTLDTELNEGSIALGGWIGGPNGRARFALILAAFIVGYGLSLRSLRSRVSPFIAVGILGASVIIQLSRSTMIVLLAVGMVYVLRQPKLKWSGLARITTVLAGLLIFTMSLLSNPGTQSKIEDFNLSANPISKRTDLVVESLQATADTWFIGKGFNRHMSNTGGFEGYPTLERGVGTHNLYLETLLDSGIIGLGFLIAILISVIHMGMALEKSPYTGSAALGTGVYLMMIAAALSFLAGHGMIKNISPLGILWILAGAAARRFYDEKRINRLFVAT